MIKKATSSPNKVGQQNLYTIRQQRINSRTEESNKEILAKIRTEQSHAEIPISFPPASRLQLPNSVQLPELWSGYTRAFGLEESSQIVVGGGSGSRRWRLDGSDTMCRMAYGNSGVEKKLKTRVPPERGQIKAKIMGEFIEMVVLGALKVKGILQKMDVWAEAEPTT
ncbi:hypothetical protein AKJ16_DCAP00668 [Drosera capensis]